MYSQYQSYQQQNGGTAVATHQPGMTWNGTSWVPSAVASATVASYSQQQQSQVPPNPVQTYTQYYHEYTRRQQEYQRMVDSLSQGSPPRAQAQQQVDWNKYYAEMSSRAAHHFHQNPGVTAAPFELPPAPQPQNDVATQQQSSYPQNQHQPQSSNGNVYQQTYQRNEVNQYQQNANAYQPQTQQPKVNTYQPQYQPNYTNSYQSQQMSTNANPSPPQQQNATTTLKQYVDRCLQQCTSPEEKKQMALEVEKAMKQAMAEEKFHSPRYWETLELLPVPGRHASPVTPSISGNDNYYGLASTNNGSHYGPATNTSSKKKRRGFSDKPIPDDTNQLLPVNDSYYGPAAGSTHNSSTPQLSNDSYYGPTGDFVPLSRKKRKSPPKRQSSGFNQSDDALDHRAKRFAGLGRQTNGLTSSHDRYMGKGLIGGAIKKLDEDDYEHMIVKGTSTTLEKDYLRLTAPPKAELVRPQPILEQHLANLKAELKREDRRDYLWFCSQFKAVRQDCTVQRIQNAFAVDVYETHARIALEEGDLNEYNQCQTQLKYLYETLKDDDVAVRHQNEFVAYRLLYYVFLTGNQKYDGGSSDMFKIMLSLTSEQHKNPAIEHALKVRVACTDVDYHAFFCLRRKCPNLGSYLLDRIVPGMRHKALQRICKAYRPLVPVGFCLRELGFSLEKESDLDFGRKWLLSCGCVLNEDGSEIKAKETVVRESDTEDKKSLI